MRKCVLTLAAAAAALAIASPAAAQYSPEPLPHYGNSYAYPPTNGGVTPPSWGQYPPTNGGIVPPGWGHWGQVRQLQARIDALQNRIRFLDRRDVIRNRTADRLKDEARDIEKRLHKSARYGLNPYEMNNLQVRIARLEQRVQFASNRLGGRGYGYNGSNNGGYYGDRDRDGRDDRWEDDRGHDHDD